MNGVHDMGGDQGMGPIEYEKDEPVFHAPWEGRVYAAEAPSPGFRSASATLVCWKFESVCERAAVNSSRPSLDLSPSPPEADPEGERGTGPVLPSTRTVAWA